MCSCSAVETRRNMVVTTASISKPNEELVQSAHLCPPVRSSKHLTDSTQTNVVFKQSSENLRFLNLRLLTQRRTVELQFPTHQTAEQECTGAVFVCAFKCVPRSWTNDKCDCQQSCTRCGCALRQTSGYHICDARSSSF